MTLGGFAREYPATPGRGDQGAGRGGPVPARVVRHRGRGLAGAVALRRWDKAASLGGDWTAGGLLALHGGVWYIVDMRRMRGLPGDVEALIRQTAELDGRGMPVVIEQEPGSSGVDVIAHYQRSVLVGFNVRGDKVTGNKIERMGPLAAAAQAGNVKLLRGPWNAAFLDEAEAVPFGEHDDQVDTIAAAMAKLSAGKRPFSWYDEVEGREKQEREGARMA